MITRMSGNFRSAAIVMMTLLCMSAARATVSTIGCADSDVDASCTLQELLDGGSIIVNDKWFDNWELFAPTEVVNAEDPNFNNIRVAGLDDGGSDPGPGLLFDLGSEVSIFDASESATIRVFPLFTIQILDPDLYIKDNTLTILEAAVFSTGPFAGVSIFESVGSGSTTVAEKHVFESTDGQQLTDSADYASLVSSAGVAFPFRFDIDASDDPFRATAALRKFEMRFSQTSKVPSVPEPTTLLLVGLGLAGVGFSRRRLH